MPDGHRHVKLRTEPGHPTALGVMQCQAIANSHLYRYTCLTSRVQKNVKNETEHLFICFARFNSQFVMTKFFFTLSKI